MNIRQPVKNTMDRIGLDYNALQKEGDRIGKVQVCNRFGGGCVETTPLIAECIDTIYNISNKYEIGDQTIKVSDFDRLRYFVLEADSNAYYTCID